MTGALRTPAVRAACAALAVLTVAELGRAAGSDADLSVIGVVAAFAVFAMVLVFSDREAIHRAVISRRFARALEHGVVSVHYQPIVNLRSGRVVGTEALIRWLDPRRGMVPPDSFIRYLAGTPAERALTEFVLEQAVAQVAEWRAAGLDLRVSVNVSPRLLGLALEETVTEILARHEQPPAVLHLELTEHDAEDDAVERSGEHAAAVARLRGLGLSVSLDDFGCARSSLARLSKLPVDTLKIDRSFVAEMDREVDAEVLRSMISLGHALGLDVVAEGIETEEQWQRLKAWGCDLAQGYLICRPQAAEQIDDWMRSEGPRSLAHLSELSVLIERRTGFNDRRRNPADRRDRRADGAPTDGLSDWESSVAR